MAIRLERLRDYNKGELNSALFKAVRDSNVDIVLVRNLISHGAELNAINTEGMTPVQFATARRSTAGVETLVKLGADVNATGNIDKTPLEIANEIGYYHLINMLKSLGAK